MKYIRTLIAAIRYLGKRPCPKCWVEKINIHWLGSLRDFWTRRRPRVSNQALLDAISIARKSIFWRGISVASQSFTTLINNGWNPVPVCATISGITNSILTRLLERFLRQNSELQLLLHDCARYIA